MFTVQIAEKDGQPETLNFDKTEISIGRVKGNDIVLPKGNVSKRHSRIVVKDGKFIVVDLKSTNGTYVNGRKITSPQVIKSADKVYIGDFVLSVADQVGEAPAPPQGLSGELPPAVGSPSDIQPMAPPPASPPAPSPVMSGGLPPVGRPSSPAMPAAPPPEIKPARTPTVAAPAGGGQPPRSVSPLGGPPSPSGSMPSAAPPGRGLGGPPSPGLGGPPPASGGLGGPPSPGLGSPSSTSPGLGGPPPGRGLGAPPSGNFGSPSPPGRGLGAPSSPGLGGPPSPGLGGPTPASGGLGGPPSPGLGRTPSPSPVNGSPSVPKSPVGLGAPPSGNFGAPASRPPEANHNHNHSPAPASAVSQIPGLMLHTPGASAIPPKPDFVPQRDEGFAAVQAQAAEAFFGSIDPQTLPMYYPPRPEDRQIFEQTVNDIVGSLGAGADLVEHLLGEAIGLGPLEALLDDPSVEEIYVNNYAQVLFRQNGRIVTAPRAYSHPEFLFLTAQRLLSARVEEGGDLADEVRFSDGTRVHILMPPLAPRGPVLTVRKARAAARSIDDLTAAGALSAGMASMLRSAVEAGRSIVVAGPSDRARTEVLNAIGNLIPEGTRILAVENVGGLQLGHQSAVYMEEGAGNRQHYGMRYLLKSAMRMRPERIIVNSLTGPEAYDWVCSAAAGTFGSMASCAGVATSDVLERLQSLCLLGAESMSARGLREQIARAVHVVVVVHQAADGSPRIQQISEVQGIDLDTFRVSDVFYFRPEGSAGQFVATGYVPAFYEALRIAGINADTRIFNT